MCQVLLHLEHRALQLMHGRQYFMLISRQGMDQVRSKFKSVGLECYDVLSPPLMDLIATFTAQKAGVKFSNL